MNSLNSYREWLRGLVDRPGPFYDILFDLAWEINFEHDVPNDVNRASDGLDLRRRFESETFLKLSDFGECRMLEFLIGLAIRCNSTVYDNLYPDLTSHWFWLLLNNLGIDMCTDDYLNRFGREEVVTVFQHLNQRMYNSDGSDGGLFPLEDPQSDQTTVEIWYQMMSYLLEKA